MITTEPKLKRTLLKIKENNWLLPKDIEPYEFSKTMLAHIGSTDPVLRDKLILEMLLKIIEQNQITNEQMKELLADCLGEKHLFCGVGKKMDDSVFNRTFTVLIIEGIVEANNRADVPFLTKQEVVDVHKKLVEYSRKEKDLRGYVVEKGWAHSTAHTADALNSIVHAKEIGHQELFEIMDLIRYKICDETYVYIDNEEERLITTFTNIYDRGMISTAEIVDWLTSFLEVSGKDCDPDREHLRQNRKLFFRSLEFRVRKLKYEKEILQTIDEILDSHACR